MFMVQLVYASTTQDITPDAIEAILQSARVNNEKHGVTGMLHFNSRYFLQCLEGSREKVNLIYHKILNDSRHTHPVLLTYRGINERSFAKWSMAYVGEGKRYGNHFFRFSLQNTFNPYTMSGDSAFMLLRELAESVE